MVDNVASHYTSGGDLASAIAESLRKARKEIGNLTAADLATVDEFHIRGRQATLELARSLNLSAASRVLDIGSGLGGPTRTLVETYRWPAPGSEDTQLRCLLEPEVDHGEAEIYARVQG